MNENKFYNSNEMLFSLKFTQENSKIYYLYTELIEQVQKHKHNAEHHTHITIFKSDNRFLLITALAQSKSHVIYLQLVLNLNLDERLDTVYFGLF